MKGNPNGNGELIIQNIMADEKVEVGERVLTSGGDRIFPKGMPVGVVSRFAHGKDIFLDIWVKPAAQLSRAEEVLVVTKVDERTPQTEPFAPSPVRAIDILAERLPTVAPPPKPDASATTPAGASSPETKPKAAASAGIGSAVKAAQTQALPKSRDGRDHKRAARRQRSLQRIRRRVRRVRINRLLPAGARRNDDCIRKDGAD